MRVERGCVHSSGGMRVATIRFRRRDRHVAGPVGVNAHNAVGG
jgi:hypothetical protein